MTKKKRSLEEILETLKRIEYKSGMHMTDEHHALFHKCLEDLEVLKRETTLAKDLEDLRKALLKASKTEPLKRIKQYRDACARRRLKETETLNWVIRILTEP